MVHNRVALIVDIVRSRELSDRASAQSAIRDAFAIAHEADAFVEPLWPTVGDEFQAVFATVAQALKATAIARLHLPDGIDCRFGLGSGEMTAVEEGRNGTIQDGSAWWCAREAITEAHRRENKANPYLRTWFISDSSAIGYDAVVNSYLLLRDHAISTMAARERRLAAGALLGLPQAELAKREDITQSAVSQNLRRSGAAALLSGHQLLSEGLPL